MLRIVDGSEVPHITLESSRGPVYAALHVPELKISLPLEKLFNAVEKKPLGSSNAINGIRFSAESIGPLRAIKVTILDENSGPAAEPVICEREMLVRTSSSGSMSFRKLKSVAVTPQSEWIEPSQEVVRAQELYNALIDLDEDADIMGHSAGRMTSLTVPDVQFKVLSNHPLRVFDIDCVWREIHRRDECCLRIDTVSPQVIERLDTLISEVQRERTERGNVRNLLRNDRSQVPPKAERAIVSYRR